jgi:hypothetical protein
LYEYIKKYDEFLDGGTYHTKLAISVFINLWNRIQLWKDNDVNIENPLQNDPKPHNFIARFSKISENVLFKDSQKKENEYIQKSEAEALLMKRRYTTRLEQEKETNESLLVQSNDWLVTGTTRRKQLTGLGQQVLSADVQTQKQESKAISNTGKKLFSAMNNSNMYNHWKLDMYENKTRMRRRLTQNIQFNEHSDASTKRDKIPMARSESIPMLKVLKSHSDVFDEPRPSKLNRYHQFSSNMRTESGDSMLSETSFDTDDWNVVPSEDPTLKISMHNWDVELINLMHSVRGKLFLTSEMIGFLTDDTKSDQKSGPISGTAGFESKLIHLGNIYSL